MAQIHWINAAGGDFNTALNWSPGSVPGPGDDAIINAPTKAGYTVTTGVNDTVNSIQTIALTTLSIGGNALFIASACSRAGTGGLAIRKLTIDNSSGGSLLGVSHVDLQSTTLIGGTLKTIGTGVIDTVD